MLSGHDSAAENASARCPYRTQAATPAPSAANTRASTKAGVGPFFASDVLVATGETEAAGARPRSLALAIPAPQTAQGRSLVHLGEAHVAA
jgi:hypothetical protein